MSIFWHRWVSKWVSNFIWRNTCKPIKACGLLLLMIKPLLKNMTLNIKIRAAQTPPVQNSAELFKIYYACRKSRFQGICAYCKTFKGERKRCSMRLSFYSYSYPILQSNAAQALILWGDLQYTELCWLSICG